MSNRREEAVAESVRLRLEAEHGFLMSEARSKWDWLKNILIVQVVAGVIGYGVYLGLSSAIIGAAIYLSLSICMIIPDPTPLFYQIKYLRAAVDQLIRVNLATTPEDKPN